MMKKTLAIAACFVVLAAVFYAVGSANGSGGYQCLLPTDGTRIKTESAINENYDTISSSFPIIKVVVKAGQNCVEVYPTNTAPTCYTVSRNAENTQFWVSRIGSGPECQGISHLEALIGSEEEKCVETTTVYGPWTDWYWNDVRWERYRTITILDQDGETVCGQSTEYEYMYPEEGYFASSDCKGWQVYHVVEGFEPVLVDDGQWKDLITDESFYWGEERLLIVEPQDCSKPCISEKVFYWDDGWCKIRQRGGPIGGQTRPFVPFIYAYCGCGYEWGAWVGKWADSCEGDGSQYKYWNELPEFCGYQSCE